MIGAYINIRFVMQRVVTMAIQIFDLKIDL